MTCSGVLKLHAFAHTRTQTANDLDLLVSACSFFAKQTSSRYIFFVSLVNLFCCCCLYSFFEKKFVHEFPMELSYVFFSRYITRVQWWSNHYFTGRNTTEVDQNLIMYIFMYWIMVMCAFSYLFNCSICYWSISACLFGGKVIYQSLTAYGSLRTCIQDTLLQHFLLLS